MAGLKLYVVEVGPQHQVGLLHDLTARHLLTHKLSVGDKIAAIIDVQIEDNGRIRGSLAFEDCTSGRPIDWVAQVTTVLGRSPFLGEDGAEEAFGHDAILLYCRQLYESWYSENPSPGYMPVALHVILEETYYDTDDEDRTTFFDTDK